MAPKPEKIAWIDDDATNIVEPSGSRKTSGWQLPVKPPAENFNWFWNLVSRVRDWMAGESQYDAIIDSDTDEGDYTTLVAYLADNPAAKPKVLVKNNQAITAKLTMLDDLDITFLKGVKITTADDLTTVFELGNRVTVKGTLTFELSHTGTITNLIRFNGDDSYVQNAEVKNLSTGTITSAYKIEANKDGNICRGLLSGSGTITNVVTNISGRLTNDFVIRDDINNAIVSTGLVDLTSTQTINGVKTFTSGVTVKSIAPRYQLIEDDAPSDNQRWDFIASAGQLLGRLGNDAQSVFTSFFAVSRTDTVADLWNFLTTNLQHNGNKVITDADAADIKTLYENNANTNEFSDAEKAFLAAIETKTKIIEIGDWNMDVTATVNINHGLALGNIRTVNAMIRDDVDSNRFPLSLGTEGAAAAWIANINSTNVSLNRLTGGGFDNVNYDSTSYNRGWIVIGYV